LSEQSIDDRDSFRAIASVAHELRTPLTAIQGAVEVLRDEAAGELTSEQREFVNLAHRNLERLKNRIEDALDIAELPSRGTGGSVVLQLPSVAENIVRRAAIESGPDLTIEFKGFEQELALSIPETTICRTLASIAATVARHGVARDVRMQVTLTGEEARFEVAAVCIDGPSAGAPEYVMIHDASLAMAQEMIGRHEGSVEVAERGRCAVYVLLPLRSIENERAR
jgi:signal transduction histidine kinase